MIQSLSQNGCLLLSSLSEGTKLKFREVEKIGPKICLLNSHLSFNETCLNTYKYIECIIIECIYLCIHIYIYMRMFLFKSN